MDAQHGALLPPHLLLVVGVAQHHEHHAVDPRGGLDDVGDVAAPAPGLHVAHLLARVLLVPPEVEVGTVVDALQLLPPDGEQVLDVHRPLRVVRQFVGAVLAEAERFGPYPERMAVERHARLAPVLEPLLVGPRLDEELHLGLFELARAEDEVAGRDLVSERLADLGHAEGDLLARGGLHVEEVDVRPLRRLGTQVDGGGGLLNRAHEGLEHQVEQPGLAEGTGLERARRLARLPAAGGALHLVRAIALPADLALHQGIGEAVDVPRSLPHARMHEDGRLDPLDIVALVHHRAPPSLLDVALEFDAQRPVVPHRSGAAVDLGRLKDVPATLGQRDELVHAIQFRHNSLYLVGSCCVRNDRSGPSPSGPPECGRRVRGGISARRRGPATDGSVASPGAPAIFQSWSQDAGTHRSCAELAGMRGQLHSGEHGARKVPALKDAESDVDLHGQGPRNGALLHG